MSDNSYAQLIDDFDAGIQVLEGETLTEYIKRMGGVDYESKADGGAIGIEVLFKDKMALFSACGLPLKLVEPALTTLLLFTITHPTAGFSFVLPNDL